MQKKAPKKESPMGFLMPKTPSLPPMPKPLPPPPVPSVDTAREQADADLAAVRRRGAMANIFASGATGTALGTPTPDTSLRRVLG
jgi:hypothetical protein